MREHCSEMRSLFDRLLDRDLPENEVSRVEKHLEACPSCRLALQEERDIISSFELLPELECPESVLHKIEAAIPDREKHPESYHSPFESLRALFKPYHRRVVLLGTATAAVLALVIMNPFTTERGPVQIQPTQDHFPGQYSQEDIRRVRETAKWSLIFTTQTISTTEKGVVKEVLADHLPATVRKSIRKSL